MDLNEKKYYIKFLKSNFDKIKLPLYNVEGVHDIYIIKEFRNINKSIFIKYINTKNKEFHSNLNDINFPFLVSIYKKALSKFKNNNIWDD